MRAVQSTVAPHVTIEYDETLRGGFAAQVDEALGLLASKPTGHALLAELARFTPSGKHVTIRATSLTPSARPKLTAAQVATHDVPAADVMPEHNALAFKLANKVGLGRKGEGTSAVINWNPDVGLRLDDQGVPIAADDASKSHLALAHEMIHALRFLKGTSTGANGDRYDAGSPAGREESRAVGIDGFEKKRFSENAVRLEHDEPLRTAYARRPA